jgi:hypothetical protein
MADETVLVTGASAGIGRALAPCFAADGADLILLARRRDALDALATELAEKHGTRSRVMVADLAEAVAPEEIAATLASDGVDVDVVVNDAGFGALGPVAGVDERRQADMVQVNVMALTRLTRLFLPAMIERRRGGVLNLASTAAFQPGPNMAVYYATKAYVLSFTEALAEELKGSGVTATALCPGVTRTEFQEVAGMGDVALLKILGASPEAVARTGHRAFRAGKAVAIHGLANRLGVQSLRLSPRAVVRKVIKALQS